jgi:hypothetical protein
MQDKGMTPPLFDLSLDELRHRLDQLEEWGRVLESGDPEALEELRAVVFRLGGSPDDDWNDYHRVRNEFDRRAAEEFDLGQ